MACEANTDWNAPTRRGSTGAAALHTLPYARLPRPDSRPAVLGVALLEGSISSEAPCSQTCCNAHAAGGCNSGSVTPSTTASVQSPEIKPLDSFPPQKAGLVCEASTDVVRQFYDNIVMRRAFRRAKSAQKIKRAKQAFSAARKNKAAACLRRHVRRLPRWPCQKQGTTQDRTLSLAAPPRPGLQGPRDPRAA